MLAKVNVKAKLAFEKAFNVTGATHKSWPYCCYTGSFKINGVLLRRVNQAYVTSYELL
ncbi:hypothetical protein Syun_026232 [Stephania yunnanensis]|uniref:Uncharacterized protein n=1 Tax=Stephania yunnanensis TaxID=152371 RepID=A0AAP0EW07_9MAGN